MTTKPEALLIAELWDDYLPAYNYKQVASDTARELRRLHEENREMLAVLKLAVAALDGGVDNAPISPVVARAAQAWMRGKFGDAARAAIKKAEAK